MYAMGKPRSILKHNQIPPCSATHQQPPSSSSSARNVPSSPHRPCGSAVRFPSSPKMSTVYFTHCPTSYDRRPIVVLPNSCALPDRGQRDLSGASSSSPQTGQTALHQSWGNHVHPSVFGRMCNASASPSPAASSDEDSDNRRHSSESADGGYFSSMHIVPSLTHDDVSSEESDGIASPPPETYHGASVERRQHYTAPSQSHLHSEPLSHPPISDYYVANGSNPSACSDYSLAFLPHAPSSSYSPRKRSEKKRSGDSPFSRKCSPNGSFIGGSSWAVDAEDSSCLGGF